MPISAWCLQYIVNKVQTSIGVKAIFLRSVPTAERFYKRNGFVEMNAVMEPFHCVDDDFTPLWLPLQKIVFGEGVED